MSTPRLEAIVGKKVKLIIGRKTYQGKLEVARKGSVIYKVGDFSFTSGYITEIRQVGDSVIIDCR